MLKNNLTIALRMLRKNKLYSAINVLGLALGIASCLLIAYWATDEVSFDRFHVNGDRIYRMNKVYTPTTGGTELHALTPGPMASTLKADFPEIESAVRVMPSWGGMLLINGETSLPTNDVLFVDDGFLDLFTFQLIRGDRNTALAAPLSIVLSETLAESLFGETDPIGEAIVGLGDLSYTVTGVIEDAPARSHLRYNAFVSWSSVLTSNDLLNFAWLERWLPQTLFTYVSLRPGASAKSLEEKMPAFMQRHFPERVDQYRFYLQPLNQIYLDSRDVLHQRSMIHGSASSVKILTLVGILILLIACVNFMNLSTAQAGRRAMEVGVRKSMGAQRNQLVAQFLGEAFVMVGLALVCGLALVEAARPAFNALAGKQAPPFWWMDPSVVASLAGLALIVGLTAGLYPAFVLTRFEPTRSLKGIGFAGGGRLLRRALVTMQFAASIVLLVGTAVVFRQMNFVQSHDPGFDREHVVFIPTGRTGIGDQFEAFRTEVLSSPQVLSATGTSSVPGDGLSSFSIRAEGRENDDGLIVSAIFLSDTDLLETYGMELAEGRFFDANRPADSSAIVINEAAMRSLGWTTAVGKRFDRTGEGMENTIVGVVKDFHVASMHQAVEPIFLALDSNVGMLSVRIADGDIPATIEHLRASWEKFESRYPFEYQFLDDTFARLYEIDRQLMNTLSVFAALAILVASLGLFGLATYAAERRMKEIGVRKVLGASVASVVTLLSKDFAKLILVAFLIATPVAYVAMQRWLDGFAYRVNIGPGTLAFAGGLVLLVAILTVSTQAFRAANSDPVKTLRYE